MKTIIIVMLASMLVACQGNNAPQKATPITHSQTITLTQPDLNAGATINSALALRASARNYSSEPLSLEELSGVMWAAAGVNRPDGHLTAPSALALYPVEVFAFMAEGVYRYNSADHTLVRVAEGDHRKLSAAQDFAFEAPLNIVYVAHLTLFDNKGIDRTKAEFLSGQDAAGYAENVNLYAAGNGLKAITRGSLRSAEVLTLLGKDDGNHAVVLAQTVGK